MVTALARILALAETDWLNDPRLNMHVVVTLRQCLHYPAATEWMTEDRAEQVARQIRNRVCDAIDRQTKREAYFPIVIHLHYGDDKRYHLHILMMRPAGMSREEFDSRFDKAAKKIDWVYDHIYFDNIGPTEDDRRALLYYCQCGSRKSVKGGGDSAAMLHEAAAIGTDYKKIAPAEAGPIREAKKRSTPLRETRTLIL